MIRGWLFCATMAGAVSLSSHAVAEPGKFQDPLDTAAIRHFGVRAATTQPILALTRTGHRIVGVGLRGLILFSDDGGQSWLQADVPVQTDLVAVDFATPEQGWASGHDLVILHTADGGRTWRKQFDNRSAATVLPAYYEQRAAAGDRSAEDYLRQVKLNTQGDASLPLLGIHFSDARRGIAVGAFGMIVATEDAGEHWRPLLDRVDNPEYLNLNAIKSIDGRLYIAGEQGGVYRFDEEEKRFLRASAPYKGSFFDIVGTPGYLLAVGLRGTAYRSVDAGASWHQIDTATTETITAAQLVEGDGNVVLSTASGTLLRSRDSGSSFGKVATVAGMPLAALVPAGEDHLVLAGPRGIATRKLAERQIDAVSKRPSTTGTVN